MGSLRADRMVLVMVEPVVSVEADKMLFMVKPGMCSIVQAGAIS